MNLASITTQFADATAAREYFEKQRWPDGVVCPHCGLLGKAYRLKAKEESKSSVRPGVWKCGGCRKQFTVTKGTIFEDSHIPLNIWLMAIHLLCSSKKGISAHQIHRMLGVTYKTGWFMMHRLRYAAGQSPMVEQLTGVVEIDEAYIGGSHQKNTRKQTPVKKPNARRDVERVSPYDGKAAVVSVVQRGGEVRSQHVHKVTAAGLRPFLYHHIEYGARIVTDSSTVLHGAIHPRQHDQVNHTTGEYGRYENGFCISTNTVEGFFSLLKRGINGTYHFVSPRHLYLYLNEFDFRYNSRKITDGERSQGLIRRCGGKRITYRRLVSTPSSGTFFQERLLEATREPGSV